MPQKITSPVLKPFVLDGTKGDGIGIIPNQRVIVNNSDVDQNAFFPITYDQIDKTSLSFDAVSTGSYKSLEHQKISEFIIPGQGGEVQVNGTLKLDKKPRISIEGSTTTTTSSIAVKVMASMEVYAKTDSGYDKLVVSATPETIYAKEHIFYPDGQTEIEVDTNKDYTSLLTFVGEMDKPYQVRFVIETILDNELAGSGATTSTFTSDYRRAYIRTNP